MTDRGQPTTTSLSTDQSHALDRIIDWYNGCDTDFIHCHGDVFGGRFNSACPPEPHTHGSGTAPVYALGGLAGTGKTTLMKALEQELGVEAVFGTPTHKAAAVLRRKLPPDQAARVRTYHSMVYRMHATFHCEQTGKKVRRIVDSCMCGQSDACLCPARFDPCTSGKSEHTCRIREELTPERREFLGGHREIVIVDESSMLSFEEVTDIRSFGVPILLVGDRHQLPPVKAEMNPWITKPDVELTQIHRQGADSGILQAAHDVRRIGRMSRARYGTGDTVRMPMSNPDMEGVFERWEKGHGPDRVLITASNKVRAMFNASMHGEGTVRAGDRVVALGGKVYDALRVRMKGADMHTTGSFLQVHNGMTGTVLKTTERGGPVLDMVVRLDDHALATPDEPICILVGACARAQFGAERDLPFNSPDRPKGSRLWDYAYALTAHKAQGSEFDNVMVIDEVPPSYAQWLYTSITRAKKACLVVDYRK